MRTFDIAPLIRSTIGFDRMLDLLDGTLGPQPVDPYPPYNIEKTAEDGYRVSLAVAGFAPEALTVTTEPNALVVRGAAPRPDAEGQYLHHGLAVRPFERRFELADYVKVVEARLANGLLTIELVRELPEAMRPRRIDITAPQQTKSIQRHATAA